MTKFLNTSLYKSTTAGKDDKLDLKQSAPSIITLFAFVMQKH